MQSLNEDQKASSENTVGSFSASSGKICVTICLGLAIIGGTALGVGLSLTGGKDLVSRNDSSPLPGPENTQSFDARRARTITPSNASQQFITASITTPPKFEVSTPHASWLSSSTLVPTSTGSQGAPTSTTPSNLPSAQQTPLNPK